MSASVPLPDDPSAPPGVDAITDGAGEAPAKPPRPARPARPKTAGTNRVVGSGRTGASSNGAAPRNGGSARAKNAPRVPRAPRNAPPAPIPLDPGPPPPLPADLPAAADVVIPPKPPLPPLPALPADAAAAVFAERPAASIAEPAVDEAGVDPIAEPEAVVEPEAETVLEPDAGPETLDASDADRPQDADEEVEPQIVEPEVAGEYETTVEPQPVAEPEPEPEPGPELALGSEPAEPAAEAVSETETETEILASPEPADLLVIETAEPEPEPAPEFESDPAAILAVLDDDVAPAAEEGMAVAALELRGVTKLFGGTRAVDAIDLTVPAGSFYGLVGPNGAGKTTTLSMIAGLLRPDAGSIAINGVDARRRRREVTRQLGVLPDRLRTFDRLTGRQLLYYYGVLRGLSSSVVESRTTDLARAFDLVEALGRPVADYSAGMTKKVMLAGAMIHSPRVLVLDEPFESVDPVSSEVILAILGEYVAHGGTVILSSHGMELVERVCTRVAVIVAGQVLAEGTVAEVRGESTLEERFLQLAGGLGEAEGLEWLHTFSD